MTADLKLPGAPRPARSHVITVGTFDGVHRGHQAVLDKLAETARAEGVPGLVVTFEPHPLYVVRPEHAPKLLCSPEEKAQLLARSPADEIVVVPFTLALADLSPREFVERVLRDHFGLKHLVIGYDHGFGKGRSGDVSTLQEIGRDLGFEVTVVPHTDLDETPVSSTRIRRAIEDGEVVEAARALGRPYALSGQVVRGDGRGRQLGYPTANLEGIDPHKLVPKEGIYAVRVRSDGGPEQDGVLHLGPRPTFPGASATMEVFLIDFTGDLYGRQLELAFIARIRGVTRFETVPALIAAMTDDVEAARRRLRAPRS